MSGGRLRSKPHTIQSQANTDKQDSGTWSEIQKLGMVKDGRIRRKAGTEANKGIEKLISSSSSRLILILLYITGGRC